MFFNVFLMDHHSLRTCPRYSIFSKNLLIISKKTAIRGILPQCFIKIFKVCCPQQDFSVFFYFFENHILNFCDLQWPLMNNVAKLIYPMWLFMFFEYTQNNIYFSNILFRIVLHCCTVICLRGICPVLGFTIVVLTCCVRWLCLITLFI